MDTSRLPDGQRGWWLSSFNALGGDEDASVFWDFLVDGEEFLWVRDYDPAVHAVNAGGLGRTGPGGVWTVLNRNGAVVATVSMPADFEPSSIDADYVLGVRRDELDVESVRVYRVQRLGG